MTEGLKKVKNFLEEKSINYHVRDGNIYVPYEIGNKKFQPTISFHGKWLIISALLSKKDEIPEDKYEDLLKELLIANHELPEINFDISREGDIFTSVDMRISVLDYENFFSEFYAIPFGIKLYVESLAPKFNIDINGL